jgi:predicted nuclease of predicted toxin-antitoxin system
LRFLVDGCVTRLAAQLLRDLGHDVVEIAAAATDPGDAEVLARAHRENRVLVTMDNDFGKLVFQHGSPHAGIIRIALQSIDGQLTRLGELLRRHRPEDIEGNLVTIERRRFRFLRTRAGS